MRNHALILTFLIFLLLFPARFAGAGPYSQPGFYAPEVVRFPNGLTLILKERGEAPNVAIRLVVGIGHDDFPKGAKQTAHMVEHLLYMGTSSHDETEIDRLVQDHGGYSNAFTSNEQTIHHLDIFNQYYLWGLDFLFELLTTSTFSADQVNLAAGVIAREEGGVPSGFHRWLYEHGVTKPAWEMAYDRLLPNPDYQFALEACDGISRDELVQAFRKFYVPANMTLIVAGKFDREALLAKIGATFGTIASAPKPPRRAWSLPFPSQAAELDGTLAPILDSEGVVQVMFRTDGLLSPDYHALQVIDKYLDRKVFEELRFKRGLAYDSGSSYAVVGKWGVLAAGGTVDIERMREVKTLLETEIDRLQTGKVTAAEIDQAKGQILLAQANGYESNAAVADYYADNLDVFQARGHFQNYEDAIAAVTPLRVTDVAGRYLRPDRAVLVMSRPTVTIEELLSILEALGVLASVLAFWLISRRRRRQGGKRNCLLKP